MEIRELFGMSYNSVEMAHDVAEPISDVLYALADWLDDNEIAGIITNIDTHSDPYNEDQFLTTLVWAEF